MALTLPTWFNWILPRRATSAANLFFSLTGNSLDFSKVTDKKAIEEGFMSNLNWYAIVKKAAEGVASLPYQVEVKSGDEWEVVTEEQNEVANFFFNPNEDQSAFDLIEAAMIFYYTTGEAFFISETEAIGLNGDAIVTVPPELMKIYLESDSLMSEVQKYVLLEPNGNKKTFMPSEVCHLRMFNPSVEGFKMRNGLSPIQAAYQKLKASNNQAVGQASYFENRGVSTIISPQGGANGLAMRKEDKAAIDEATRSRLGGSHNVNGVITTMTPVQSSQLGSSASDMQMLEQGTAMLRELCNALFMPSEMFNDPDNKTHANRKEAVKTMYHDVFLPSAHRFIRSFEKSILKPYGIREDGREYRLTIDKDQISALQPNPFEYKRMLLDEVKAGTITRNEYRAKVGLEELDSDGMNEPTVQQQVHVVAPSSDENT